MARRLALCLLLLISARTAAAEEEDVLKLPIEVDQQGKTIYFVTNARSDVIAEAATFCAAHLRGMPADDCVTKLVEQVNAVRKLRAESALSLPGLTFTVTDPYGQVQRFTHEEYADPSEESRLFCRRHFPDADESECVQAMLQNAQRALEEIQGKQEL